MKKNWILSLGAVAMCVACTMSADSEESVATTQAPILGLPAWGSIPYPVVSDATRTNIMYEVDGVTPKQAWDGSLADLVAADALAQCAKTSAFYKKKSATFAGFWDDDYFSHLKSLMLEASCFKPSTANVESDWLISRTDPECNVNSVGKKAVLTPFARDVAVYDTYSANGYGTSADTTSTSNYRFWNDQALGELSVADVNLCVAQQIRQYLNDGNVLFTSGDDQADLLAIQQQRAQVAVIQYGLIAGTLTFPSTVPTETGNVSSGPWRPLYHWAKTISVTPSNLQKLAFDYNAAINLHIAATHELGEHLQRQVSGRGNEVSSQSMPADRLIALMYGGDPRTYQPVPPPGQGLPGPFNTLPAPPPITQSMSEPQVQTALTLVRKLPPITGLLGSGIELTMLGSNAAISQMDVATTATNLYKYVEAELRLDRCAIEGTTCPTRATLRTQIPDISQFESFELWKRHRVGPEHMRKLAVLFAQALGREGGGTTGNKYPTLHLLGRHESVGGTKATLLVDPRFNVTSLQSHEVGHYFQYGAFLDRPPHTPTATGIVRSTWPARRATINKRYPYAGAIPTLAYTKEQILSGTVTPTQAFAAAFFNELDNGLATTEKAIGSRAVYMRHPKGDECGGVYTSLPTNVFAKVITRTQDPVYNLCHTGTGSPDLRAVALQNSYRSYSDWTKAEVICSVPPQVAQNYAGVGAGWTNYTVSDTSTAAQGYEYYLADSTKSAIVSFGLALTAPSGETCVGKYVTFGGSLNEMVDRMVAFQTNDWSKPAYDGFGFPARWFPPASAALAGGAEQEEPHTYYLRSAKEAAAEATAAVQEAIDGLSEQVINDSDLAAAEDRAKTITSLEMKGLCGAETCNPTFADMIFTAPNCDSTLPTAALTWCNKVRTMAQAVVPRVSLGADAVAQLTLPQPDFSKYGGSDMAKVLLGQWTSARSFSKALEAVVSSGAAHGRNVNAADLAKTAAESEYTAAKAAHDLALNQLEAQNAELQAQVQTIEATMTRVITTAISALQTRNRECNNAAFDKAFQAGHSFADVTNTTKSYDAQTGQWSWYTKHAEDGASWSPGPFLAQVSKCEEAKDQAKLALIAGRTDIDALKEQKNALLSRQELTPEQRTAIETTFDAAEAKKDAAVEAAEAAKAEGWAQVAAQIGSLQSASNEVIAASLEYDSIRARADKALAMVELDLSMATAGAKTRFALNRQFRSYDMWRARALLESARRLAVAARRSLEARFVVDLSEIDSAQAFVEAPALWADEIYQPDLDAPSVVGLSQMEGAEEGAVFPNKLKDYVGNLERFVQGYPVSYPTSISGPDSEVLSIPGPDVRKSVAGLNGDEEIVSKESGGWQFYCPGTNTWIAHPGFTQKPLSSQLDVACAGSKPTKAKFAFSLDPWGRFNRSMVSEPYTERHNVRWLRLVVNIVGTGVRDCASSPDPVACYSDSFLRYGLAHSGPSWMTNYERLWRSMDLPTAAIEGGKALAMEEWLDPLSNTWTVPFVSNAARAELFTRPIAGMYELTFDVTPDVRLDRIEQIQILAETEYWVRQE